MASDLVKHLLFRVGRANYAVDFSVVQEAMNASWGIQGQVPFRGDGYPVLDMRKLFSLPPSANPEGVVVLIEKAKARAALLVDEVFGSNVVDLGVRKPLPWNFGGRERIWFSGVVPNAQGGWWIAVEPEGLLATLDKREWAGGGAMENRDVTSPKT